MSSTEPSRRGRKSFGRATLMAAAALLAFTPPVAKAAVYYFDNVAGTGTGFATNGSTVDWAASSAIWTTDSSGAVAPTNKTAFVGDTLSFNAGSNVGTIDLKTAVTGVGGWTDSLGVTLTSSTGSTLSLTGIVATFTVNGASVLSSINNVVAGTTSVKKDGDGTLRLGATNTFSGGFELLRGGLQMGATNPLGSGDIVWHRNTTISTTAASSVQNIPAAVLYLDLAGSNANTLYNTGGGTAGNADKVAYALPPDTVTYAGRSFTGKVD
jgi:fibronectin-binding autotransporter adhesin